MPNQNQSGPKQQDLKPLARQIFQETLAGIDISEAMQSKLQRVGSRITVNGAEIDLAAYDRVLAIAMGKVSVAAARALIDLLAPEPSASAADAPVAAGIAIDGILVAPYSLLTTVPGFRAIGAGHPLPDEGSVFAAREILTMLRSADEHTLIFFLLSGGGSALVALPLDPAVSLDELRELHRQLIGCGASIGEINTVRKHLSAIKGGRLAAAAPTAMKITLGITDVPAGEESALASGPTLPDPTTSLDAYHVAERYGLLKRLPLTIQANLTRPEFLPETPKPGDPAFAHSHFELILKMEDLFHHAHLAAQCRGCITICDDATDDWPIEKAADYLLGELDRLAESNPGHRVTLIADGELRSPVTGDGVGGRNSAFVLTCVEKIAGKNITVLSAGTDGQDGSSPAAGAVADGDTLARARAMGLDVADYMQRCDSYTFFKKLGDALETGPTGNNLRDLRILIAQGTKPNQTGGQSK
jgi:hydroxypyruvate reductase